MLFRSRRRFLLLLFAVFLLVFLLVRSRLSEFDEERIQNSLLNELPKLERRVRDAQANLSSLRIQLTKTNKRLSKATWHLQRLVKTIDAEQKERQKIFRSNPFDWDLQRLTTNETQRFRLFFHRPNFAEPFERTQSDAFFSRVDRISTPYETKNRSEAFFNVGYWPIGSTSTEIDLLEKSTR